MAVLIPFPKLSETEFQEKNLADFSVDFSTTETQRPRASSTSSRKSLFSVSTYDPTEDPYVRYLNLPVILTAAIMNITFGGGMIGLEVAALIFGKIHNQDGMFADVAPGIWLGAFFLVIAALGLLIRHRYLQEKPVQNPLLAVYLGFCLISCFVSLAMISYISYVLICDRMTYRLCFGESCLFDLRVFSSPASTSVGAADGGNGSDSHYCNDTVVHDVYITMLFTMIIAYLLLFIFAFTILKITVRWAEFYANYARPEMKRLLAAIFCLGRQRSPKEKSVYNIEVN